MRLRTNGFRLVMTNEERRLLASVAAYLRRTESDTVRWLVAEEAVRLGVTSTKIVTTDQISSHG
jgi:hypothetical protein